MEQVKIKRVRYPKEMSMVDKRHITLKSGYLASASLKKEHRVVYRNMIRKHAMSGDKKLSVGHAMSKMNKKYPERYQELRLKFQSEMVAAWEAGMLSLSSETEKVVVDSTVIESSPKTRGGFFSRLFRRGL